MKVVKLKKNHTFSRAGSYFVEYWPKGSTSTDGVPLFHVSTFYDFNELVGYAKFLNGSLGTVLYRGQNKDYGSLVPSGARKGVNAVSTSLTSKICADPNMVKFFQLNDKNIAGWIEYQQVITESVIQHYGGNTYCMDFVDNHWCALWFGVNKFYKDHYRTRTDDSANLYVYLYVADTNTTAIRGMHIGEDTYVVDLRKALPSTFQRPASQHGWIVRKREIRDKKCDYNDRVIGVIELNVGDAKAWLGNGSLLSQENFFPSYTIDQGYKVLLERQHRSGIISSLRKLLPMKTICNYHLKDTFYCSDPNIEINTIRPLYVNGKEIKTIVDLYSVLLTYGWQENTRNATKNASKWNEERPWEYQSAPTALLVQRYFGGDICSRACLERTHYFNLINGVTVDLTSLEIYSMRNISPYDSPKVQNLKTPKNTVNTNAVFLNQLFKNCGIPDKIKTKGKSSKRPKIIYRERLLSRKSPSKSPTA